MSVMRLGYVHARVTDMDDALSHYCHTMGLQKVAEEPGKVFLKAWDEYDHHSVVLEEGGVGLVKLGYKVERPEDIEVYERRAHQFGAATERMSKGDNLAISDGVRIVMPSDHVLELYHDAEQTGTATGVLNPEAWPRDLVGVGVPRLDHALLTVEDPELVERFFKEVLDFRPAERWVTDQSDTGELMGSWMFCSNTPHDIALIKGPNAKLHHFAFQLGDWSEILRAGDLFAMDDVSVDVGPTRHGITRGQTIYFFDPSGNRNEVFAGGYQTFPDFPTITWTNEQLAKGIFYIGREINDRFTSVVT